MPAAGPRRGDGITDGASLLARFDQLEQLVKSLQGGGRGGGAAGIGGGGGGGARRGPNGRSPPFGGRSFDGGSAGRPSGTSPGGGEGWDAGGGGRGARARPGDWECPVCGAWPCFAKASACYKCREPRQGAARGPAGQRRGTGGGGPLAQPASPATYLGPVGANGSRPLLGGRAHPPLASRQAEAGSTCPTVRVPGASIAARAVQEREARRHEEAGGQGQRQRHFQHQEGAGARAPGDAPRGAQHDSTTTAASAEEMAVGRAPQLATPRPPVATANRWSALEEASTEGDDDEDMHGGDGDDAQVDNGGAAAASPCTDGAPAQEGPTHEQLRHEWDKYSAAVRLLERDGGEVPSSLIEAARSQRDLAERRWRAVKPQQPLHKRVRWAESELREAELKESARRRELDEHLAATERRTRDLEARLEIDRARTARKRAALEDLRGRGSLSRCPATEAAARMALVGIADDIAPTMSAIAASLGNGDTQVRKDIQIAIQSLSKVEDVLREATKAAEEGRPPSGTLGTALGATHFDISGEPGGGADNATPIHQPSHTPPGPTHRWTLEGAEGRWKKARTSAEVADEARQLLRDMQEGGTAGAEANGVAVATAMDACQAAERQEGARGEVDEDPTRTNDIAEATRRSERAAQRQFQESQLQQHRQADQWQQQAEQEQRKAREHQQQQELQKHQAALERAAAERAELEAKQREDLVASMSPAELARAAEVYAQQQAVAAHAFGSLSASHVAGLVHQAHVDNVIQEATSEGAVADPEFLMSLSPEELAQWERDRQGESGAVPW